MKNNIFFPMAILLSSIALLINACKKDVPAPAQFLATDFPISVGNWWRYQHVDSIANTIDTMTLQVVSKAAWSDTVRYRCNLYEKGLVVDSSYFIISPNYISYRSVNIYEECPFWGNFVLKLPFQSNDKWVTFIPSDTTKVVSNGSYTVLGKSYSNAFTLKRKFYSADVSVHQTLILSPKIGVISQSYLFMDNFFGFYRDWGFQLIDYHLN